MFWWVRGLAGWGWALTQAAQILQGACVVCGVEAVLAMLQREAGSDLALKLMCVVAHDRAGCGHDAQAKARRAAVHVLAVKDAPFSEVDSHLSPDAAVDLELVLRQVADFHPAGTASGGSAFYSLKPALWREVEFGGLYLRWTAADEERAMARWRRHAQVPEDDLPPLVRLAPARAPFAALPHAVLTCPAVRRAAVEGLAGAEAVWALNLLEWGLRAEGGGGGGGGEEGLEGALRQMCREGGQQHRARACLELMGAHMVEPDVKQVRAGGGATPG
jgi:hypothetical protein